MKAISLWQPWASAVALGEKRIETRSWETSHRGPIAIHAGKRSVDSVMYSEPFQLLFRVFHGIVAADLPLGAIVATATLVDCVPTVELRLEPQYSDLLTNTERMLGDYGLGRFGWILKDIRALETPIPFRGRQRVFNLPEGLLS